MPRRAKLLYALQRIDTQLALKERRYREVQAKLGEFGFAPDQVRFETRDTLTTVAGGIVKEVKKGGYDTIVLGRRGGQPQAFTGRVSHHVLNELADKAVWIVP